MVPFFSKHISKWLNNQTLLNKYHETPKIRAYMGLYEVNHYFSLYCYVAQREWVRIMQ